MISAVGTNIGGKEHNRNIGGVKHTGSAGPSWGRVGQTLSVSSSSRALYFLFLFLFPIVNQLDVANRGVSAYRTNSIDIGK